MIKQPVDEQKTRGQLKEQNSLMAVLAISFLLASVTTLFADSGTGAYSASDSFSVSLVLTDDVPPSITVNSPKNTSLSTDHHIFNVSLSETGNCTLHLNGTDYINTSNATKITWYITGLGNGNYSTIYYTCEDLYGNSGDSNPYWLRVDTISPAPDWNWSDINSTIHVNYTRIGVHASEAMNCTLHFNGTDYVNSTSGMDITWSLADLANGNYSSVWAACEDTAGNSANTTLAWLTVNYTALSVVVTKSVDASVVEPGDILNWTIVVNNTGSLTVNVTLNDSNGRNFTISLLAPGASNTTSYTTTASCSSITNLVNATIVGPYGTTTSQSSASVLVSHCGDKICNCGETWRTCRRDCKKPKKEEEVSEAVTAYLWPGYPRGDVTTPPEAEIEIIVRTENPQVGRTLTVSLVDSSGIAVDGELIITKPDGSSFKMRLEDGDTTIVPDQSGYWIFTYVTPKGDTIVKRIFLREAPPAEQLPSNMETTIPSKRPDMKPEAVGGGLWLWIIAAIGVIIILAILFRAGRIGEPPRRISNLLRATKYNITKR